ncbi:Uncharacterised protein [Vibrio cholerae]|nr:Uncharacterised protein [Vibrio cholerae]
MVHQSSKPHERPHPVPIHGSHDAQLGLNHKAHTPVRVGLALTRCCRALGE